MLFIYYSIPFNYLDLKNTLCIVLRICMILYRAIIIFHLYFIWSENGPSEAGLTLLKNT